MRRRNPLSFFANPYVVLADVMVSLVFIMALFLLSINSAQMQRIAERNRRLKETSESLVSSLIREGVLPKCSQPIKVNVNKRRIEVTKPRVETLLEVEDDGTLQRFRFPSGVFNFKKNSTDFESPQKAQAVLRALGEVLLHNRAQIKSVVVEGFAQPTESNPWQLSQSRAEKIRAFWQQEKILETVTARFSLPIFKWMEAKQLWKNDDFSEWHLQEYQARRRIPLRKSPPAQEGVFPEAWVIVSGRGDSVQNGFVVDQLGLSLQFKIEYAERSAQSLDRYLSGLKSSDKQEALRLKLIQTARPTPTPSNVGCPPTNS